jgi:hypothetical protein
MNPLVFDTSARTGVLDIKDLLDDGQTGRFSDYLTLSVNSDGQNTTVSFTTTSAEPETFLAFLPGIAASNLQSLLSESALAGQLEPHV